MIRKPLLVAYFPGYFILDNSNIVNRYLTREQLVAVWATDLLITKLRDARSQS